MAKGKNTSGNDGGQTLTGDNVVGFPKPAEDRLQTFQLETSLVRGRVIRLGPVVNDIVSPHNYPLPVARVVAEAATLALMLSSMLKYQGIFTLQLQGDGPLSMIVADVVNHVDVRACASFKPERLAAKGDDEWTQAELFGKGYIAFTVDQGEHSDRYQGIVELTGPTLSDAVAHYFTQSEQLRTMLKLAVNNDDGTWRSGGIMIQSMPLEPNMVQDEIHQVYEEDWNRAKILMGTVRDDELLDPRLHENTLLMRLFHEEGVRIYDPQTPRKGCRCTMDKLRNIIRMMPDEDQKDMVVDGAITLTCEFCNKDFVFQPSELQIQDTQTSDQSPE